MAKRNKVYIDIEVNGKMEKVAVDAKKVKKSLDDVGKSAHTADRNLKGAAQASSNATKNFSKMAQGTNGLVAAYATFAAQVFALTAAFGFFKRAGDLKVLQQGQQAYAAATGTAMKVLAKDIMAAADAQITFRDASQAAAIGTASGLSSDQLTKLGKAAKDVSAVLGRDVTDSFNRLVRGVTKAEPELLDELGIVLRLKTATEEYAASLNKSADDLTAFERSQAVANNVLTQAEEKYSKILAITGGGSANEFNKLSVALDEVVMSIQNALLPVASSLAKVLTDMPILAGASFALFLSGPLKAMGFNLKEVGEKSRVAAFTQRKEFAKNKAAIEAVNISLAQQQALLKANAAAALQTGTPGPGGPSKLLQQVDKGGIESLSPQGSATLKRATDAALKNVNKHGIVTKGIYKGVRVEIVKEMQLAFKNIEMGEKLMVSKSKLNTMRMKGHYLKMSAAIQGATAKMAAGFSRLAGALGWIGIAVMAFGALKEALTVEKELTDDEKAAERLKSKVADLNKEMEHYLSIQKELVKDGSSSALMNLGASIGKQIGQVGIGDNLGTLQDNLAAVNEVAAKKAAITGTSNSARRRRSRIADASEEDQAGAAVLQRQIDAIDLLQEKSGFAYSAFEEYKAALMDPNTEPEALNAAAVAAQELSSVMDGLPRQVKASDDGIQSFVNSLAPLNQAEQAMKDIQTELASYTTLATEGGLTPAQQERVLLLAEEFAFMQEINDAAHQRQLASMRATQEVEKASLIQQKVAQNVAMTAAKQVVAETAIANKKSEIATLEKVIAKDGKDATPAQQRQLDILKEELISLGYKKDLAAQIAEQTEKESEFRQNLVENGTLQRLLQAEQQLLSLDQKRLKLAQDRQRLVEQEATRKSDLAKRNRERNTPFAFMDQKQFNAAEDLRLAEELKESQITAIREEEKIRKQMIEMEYDLLDAKLFALEQQMRLLAVNPEATPEQQQTALGLADKISDQRSAIDLPAAEGGLRAIALALAGDEADSRVQGITDNILKLKDAKEDVSFMADALDRIENTIHGSLTQAFADIITGTASVKEAFANMATAVLKMLAQIIAEMMAMYMIKMALGMITGPSTAGMTDFNPGYNTFDMNMNPGGTLVARTGGVFSNGRKMGYSSGGIASGPQAGYPVMMHGTEAIVPLPNGKSIPVEMKGAGQQNNVTVNVAVDNNGGSSMNLDGSSGPDGAKLGQAIASAVQKELLNQKRSGGILDAHGVG